MGVTKEFFCPGHGSFESERAVCPHGCTVEAEREFLTAPAYHSGVTQKTDALVRSQVEAMGLSNIHTSLREGDTARIESQAERRAREFNEAIQKKYPRNWGGMLPGGTFNARDHAVENPDRGQGALSVLAEQKAAPSGDLVEVAGLRGAKHPYEAVRDPGNLKIDKAA